MRADLVPVLKTAVAVAKTKDDDNARMILEYLRKRSVDAQAKAGVKALAAIRAEAGRHTRKWTASVNAGTGVDVSALLADDDLVDLIAHRSGEFNSLIRSLSEDVLSRIERKTLGSIFEGKGNREVQAEIEAATAMGRDRAKLIARDQASKLNGAMNEFRQRQAGVTHYTWRTVIDGRERPTHNARNGKVFPWDKPPSGGPPGREINCRCRASAVLIDTPDEAAELVGETEGADDPEEVSDLIRGVAPIARMNVTTASREAMLIKAAEVQKARSAFTAVRRDLEASDIEGLFEDLFGFPSEGQDIDRMSGRGVLGSFGTRRSMLIAAIEARLRFLAELTEHAAETAAK